jgi:hypothetical protein
VNAAVPHLESARHIRLTALVSTPEGEQIAQRAAAAGLSVSAYLRDRALGLSAEPDEPATLRQIDALIVSSRMERI